MLFLSSPPTPISNLPDGLGLPHSYLVCPPTIGRLHPSPALPRLPQLRLLTRQKQTKCQLPAASVSRYGLSDAADDAVTSKSLWQPSQHSPSESSLRVDSRVSDAPSLKLHDSRPHAAPSRGATPARRGFNRVRRSSHSTAEAPRIRPLESGYRQLSAEKTELHRKKKVRTRDCCLVQHCLINVTVLSRAPCSRSAS
jgi:hypothetical protein